MSISTIIWVIVGAVGGWSLCQWRMDRQVNTTLTAMRRNLEFQKLLVQQLQERSAVFTGLERRVLQRIEQGRLEQAKLLLADTVAEYYQSWKGNSEQPLTATIAQELAAIERDAESVPSLRAALQRPSTDARTSG